MSNFIGISFITLAAVQVLGTLAYLIQVSRLFRRLENRHKAVHESIGSPSLIMNNTPRNNILFLRWIWKREFQALEDSDSVALASLVRSLLIVLLSGFAVLIALYFAAIFTP
jgi:hypothetical protein